jgi:hypothetical protein
MNVYKKPAWAHMQLRRASGLVEDICAHGVGHPNREWLAEHHSEEESWGVHGCDGCCSSASDEAKEGE